VQELFDRRIYDMPDLGARRSHVTPEEIARLGGPADSIDKRAAKKKLKDWYPIRVELTGSDAIAIAQRANAAYSDRLLAWNSGIWLGLVVAWTAIVICLSLGMHFSLEAFLITVALPIMPPLLDAFDEWLVVRSAGKQRRILAKQIQDGLEDHSKPHVTTGELLIWQDQLFALRRGSPQVPELVYKAMRRANERAMTEAAEQLAKAVRSKNGESVK
jgi:hypothetical protein